MIQKTRLGSGSSGEVIADAACSQHAGIGSKLISKTTGGYLFRSNSGDEGVRSGTGRPWREPDSSVSRCSGYKYSVCLGRRLRWTFVHDDSFIWPGSNPARLIVFIYIGGK